MLNFHFKKDSNRGLSDILQYKIILLLKNELSTSEINA